MRAPLLLTGGLLAVPINIIAFVQASTSPPTNSPLEVALLSGLILLLLKKVDDVGKQLTVLTGIVGGPDSVDERISKAKSSIATQCQDVIESRMDFVESHVSRVETRVDQLARPQRPSA